MASPIHKVDLYWPVTAAIWRNEDREGRAWYSVTLERTYKDREGRWQSTTSLNADDTLLAQKVLGIAHSEIYKMMAADRAAGREPGAEG